jgi:hypothetical protein
MSDPGASSSRVRYPQRFSHLVTRSVAVAKLTPTAAASSGVDDEVAEERLQRGLKGALHEELLAACWQHLAKGRQEEEVLDSVAAVLKKRGEKPGKVVPSTQGWNAFLVLVDVRGGTATGAAQKLLESEPGKKMADAGLVEVGKFLASELTPPPPKPS